MAGSTLEKDLNNAYEKIVHWKKNLFMLPSGAAEKSYVEEVTRLMKLWIQDTSVKSISLRAVHVMPALLLQKPSKSSKAKDHLQVLERLIRLWDEGDIEGLLYEGMTIQQRLRSDKEGMTIAKISLKFKNLMSKGNVNGALKLSTDNMHSGILPLIVEFYTVGFPLITLPPLFSILSFILCCRNKPTVRSNE